jgi:hypothetical protein
MKKVTQLNRVEVTSLNLNEAATNLTETLNRLAEAFTGLALPDKIDCAARLRGIAKTLEKIDTEMKNEIKQHRNGAKEEWFVQGHVFKARGLVSYPERLDQSLLKERFPKTHKACLVAKEQETITFLVR